MRHYLDTVDPVPGERVVIDWEDWPDGDSYVDADDLIEAADILLADPRGLQVTVYGSESKLLEELNSLGENTILMQTDLWIAHYGVDAPGNWPKKIWPTWSLFQYSETGDIDGISTGSVDLNRFNGDDEALVQWISPASAVAPPDRVPITIDITVPDNVVLTVNVTGGIIEEDK
jgi:lysozyme